MDAHPFALSTKAYVSSPEKTLFDLSLGEPQRLPFPSALLHDAIFRERINYYGSSLGDSGLRELIRHLYYPAFAGPSYELMITHGAINAIDLILRAHVKPGDEVLIPDPCFPPYHALVRYAGGTPRNYSLLNTEHGFTYSAPNIKHLINDNTRLVIVNSPHNPTGALLDDETHEELVELFKEHPNILFISDEVYSKIIHDNDEHLSLFDKSNQGFVVNSLSKSHAFQGMRIGWIMAERGLMQPIQALLQNAVGCVSGIGQEMAKKILQSDYLTTADFTVARNLATQILREHHIEFIAPKSGFFVLIAVADEQSAVHDLAQVGIRVVPGSLFGSGTKGYIRACFAQSDQEIKSSFTLLAKSLKRKVGMVL